MTVPSETRAQILASYRRRKVPVATLACRFGVSWGTCHRIISGVVPSGTRRASAKTIAKRQICARLAMLRVKKDARVYPKYGSSSAIAKKIGISSASVRRHLQSSGFKSFVRPKCVTRSPELVAKRRAFARAWSKRERDMRRIVFSDEHTVSCNDHGSRTMYAKGIDSVLRRERSRLQNTDRMMIWAAAGVGFKSDVVIVNRNGNRTMNGRLYIRQCLSPLVGKLLAQNRLFLHDGAKPHSPGIAFLKRKGVGMVENFPAYSPQLNCIEHLWAILNKRISEYKPRTMKELEAAVKAAWESISQDLIDKVCSGFRSAVERAQYEAM